MTGFYFDGVKRLPGGDLLPLFPIAASAHSRIRERWNSVQLTDASGEPIVGEQREAILNEMVLDDALWQFWLSNDLTGDQGQLSWPQMPINQKVSLLSLCVKDGRWWREWATNQIEFRSWPWQKKLAFERTAVRECLNGESLTPATTVPDPVRQGIIAKMVKWPQEYDQQNPNLSPYNIPNSYVDLVFETI